MIFSKIFVAYRDGTHLFSNPEFRASKIAPQKIFIPSGVEVGSHKHLYWLSLVAMSDRRTTSRHLYQRFAKLFSRNRKLFEIGYVPSLKRLEYLFRKYQIALPEKEIERFQRRKIHLDTYFEGNPLKIYEGFQTIEQILKNIDRIEKQSKIKIILPGAKAKILTLLAMFFYELGFHPDFQDLVPVDSWVQVISVSTGALTGEGKIRFTPLEKMIRPEMARVSNLFREIEGVQNATWILGNNLCANCARKCMRDVCPIFEECFGPFFRDRTELKNHSGSIVLPPPYIAKCETSEIEDPF